MNGMGIFEGSPSKNHTPFVAFNRVKPKYRDPEEVALRKYPGRFFRPVKLVSGGGAYKAADFSFGPGHSPAPFTDRDEQFLPVGGRPLPGDYPEDIRPYSGPGWDFISPEPSAEGLGQEKTSMWDKLVKTVTEAAPKLQETYKKYKGKSKSAKATQDAPRYTPPEPWLPPKPDNTWLYIGIAGTAVVVVGVGAYLLLRR